MTYQFVLISFLVQSSILKQMQKFTQSYMWFYARSQYSSNIMLFFIKLLNRPYSSRILNYVPTIRFISYGKSYGNSDEIYSEIIYATLYQYCSSSNYSPGNKSNSLLNDLWGYCILIPKLQSITCDHALSSRNRAYTTETNQSTRT